MTLNLTEISFENFRNYDSFSLHDIGALTILVGPNAVGKTNIMEGIQLVTALTSFRHPITEQLVLNNSSFARVAAQISDQKRQLSIALQIAEGKKAYSLNGKTRRPLDLKGTLPAVAFTPDDLNLAKGSPSVRRTALDALGAQLTPNHYQLRKDYEKVIRYKNKLLKEDASRVFIESINEQVVTCGAQLCWYRRTLFDRLIPLMAQYYRNLSEGRETLTATYVPSWDDISSTALDCEGFSRDEARDKLDAALEQRLGDEQARRRSLVGPHADAISFAIDGVDAAVYGSQGQQRSVVLAFKLAETQLIQDVLHQKPVLLLDDVMSELDEVRRAALVEFIADDVQTFITTTNLGYFDKSLLAAADVIPLSRR